MERLKQRLGVAKRALRSFREVLKEKKSEIVRDAAIQRFECTFEAVWKAAQLYLRLREGLDVSSPKGVMRGLGQVKVFSPQQVRAALAMVDDRNLTVHT